MHSSSSGLLTDKETKVLLVKAQEGETDAMEKLVESNLRLVNSIALRFKNMGKEYDDIFQVGCIGLVKAINKFNLNYNVCFSTYAVPLIMGEIRRFLRDDMSITVSRTLKEQAQIVKKGRDELTAKSGAEPTLQQLAKHLDMTIEQISLAMEAVRPLHSIYEVAFQEDGNPVYVLDHLCTEEDESGFNKVLLAELLDQLPPRERIVLKLRYNDDITQGEIGKMLGISQVQVSRIERSAITKLRDSVKKTE